MKLDSAKVAVIAVVATVLGWIVIDGQNAARDLTNERREQRTRYLVDAYHNIATAVHRERRSVEETRRLEHAIMSIQLFGTPEQFDVIRRLRQEDDGRDWTPMLEALRNYLRKELDMPSVEPGFTIWRWDVDY